MFSESGVSTYILVLAGTVFFLLQWFRNSRYRSVPTVGPSAPLLSYWGAIRYMGHAKDMLEEGYVKYGGRPFKIANFRYWQFIVSSPKLIDELRRADDNDLNFLVAVNESFELEHSLGLDDAYNIYHVPVIRTVLTRNLSVLTDDIYDEIRASYADVIPPTPEWVAVPAMDSIMQIVARTSNRIFVGLPLCRDPEFLDVSINYTTDVVKTGIVLGLIPGPLKEITMKFISNVPSLIARVSVLLEPIILERYKQMEKYGDDWFEKPNDMLQWLMDAAEGNERKPRALCTRLLLVGFAALHTSSMSFTQALYRLAARPEYIQPMREEVEAVLAEEGWSKGALQKMRRIDSFLKESQRMEGLGFLFLSRKALKDFTFSDGTFVPKGSYVSTANVATHHAADVFADPFTFDPWRFANMRDETGEGTKHQMVNTSKEFLAFGLGKHACPGRFFAANELKSMMAHLVMNYDVRMEKAGEVPAPIHYTAMISPNRTAKVLFRKRQD